MKPFLVKGVRYIKGRVNCLPGDKSIAHRAVILSSVSHGKTIIRNFPFNDDCISTVKAFKALGIKISKTNNRGPAIIVYGKGLRGLRKPRGDIFLGESGTTFRLLLGLLSGQIFKVKLTAAQSLSHRPMLRVNKPLRMMGAKINSKIKIQKSKIEEYPPIVIEGGKLKPIIYKMPVASAQVKSAILLAGLYANGTTVVTEPIKTRDHTEQMLRLFKADIEKTGNIIKIKGGKELISPKNIFVPGDISSASFFIVAASILPGSEILIKNVNLNPTRMGVINVLKRMGAHIKILNSKSQILNFEPVGNIVVESSCLKGTVVKKQEIPSLIDELPILMVAACLASGKTVFEGVGELRVKETDRIKSIIGNLIKMGAKIEVLGRSDSEKVIIEGVGRLEGSRVRSFGDHRTAMSMVVAGLKASGSTKIDDISCITKSFPGFLHTLNSLRV